MVVKWQNFIEANSSKPSSKPLALEMKSED